MMMLLEAGTSLAGWTIVVDAAFGAAYQVAPAILKQLGAQVVAINAEDDGRRINVDCGATDLRMLQEHVRAAAANGGKVAGVAFDGDADRAKFVDETGAVLDGDHTLLILATERKSRGALPNDTVVATVMSNVGLELALAREDSARTCGGWRPLRARGDARRRRTPAGRRTVGHIIDLDRNTTATVR